MQPLAVRVIGIECIERKRILFLEEQIGILNYRCNPLGCLYNLIYMDTAVFVAVQHLEGLGIELQSDNRRTQYCPQLLVKFTQMLNILTALYVNAVLSTYRGKLPIIVTHKLNICPFKLSFLYHWVTSPDDHLLAVYYVYPLLRSLQLSAQKVINL